MTENPLYRRVYGADNPLLRNWRPPSNEYAVRYNQNPNAAQDLRNLFGTFFAPNAAPQYQQYQPYQTAMPTTYNPYNNIPPNQQEINRYVQDNAISPAIDFATQQALQKMAAGGLTLGGLYKYGKDYAPFAMAWLGSQNLAQPIVNGINRFANSSAGKTLNNAVDKVIDWIF